MVEAATIDIGPIVEQLGDDVNIADVTRPEERGPAVGVFSVDIGALLHQELDAVCLRLPRGVVTCMVLLSAPDRRRLTRFCASILDLKCLWLRSWLLHALMAFLNGVLLGPLLFLLLLVKHH